MYISFSIYTVATIYCFQLLPVLLETSMKLEYFFKELEEDEATLINGELNALVVKISLSPCVSVMPVVPSLISMP